MNHSETHRDGTLFRLGALTGIGGVVAALTQAAIDPSYPDDPAKAIGQAAQSHFLTFSRVLDMTAFLLLLVAVTVVTTALASGRGGGWARLSGALFAVSAGAGAIATMIVGTLPDVAQGWVEAPPERKQGYIAAYDVIGNVSGGVFGVSWAALGFFGLTFAVAAYKSGLFSRTLTGVSIASGLSLISAIVIGIAFRIDAAFLLLVLGLLLSYVVIASSSLRLWRLDRSEPADQEAETAVLIR